MSKSNSVSGNLHSSKYIHLCSKEERNLVKLYNNCMLLIISQALVNYSFIIYIHRL